MSHGDQVLQWAKKVIHDTERAVRRIVHLYDFYLDDDDTYAESEGFNKGRRSGDPYNPSLYSSMGSKCQGMRHVKHALHLDEQNGNSYWQDSMKKEIGDLIDMDSFEFKPAG